MKRDFISFSLEWSKVPRISVSQDSSMCGRVVSNSSPCSYKPDDGFIPVFHTSAQDIFFLSRLLVADWKLNCPDPSGAFSTWKCDIVGNNLHCLALLPFLPRSNWAVGGGLGGQFPLPGFSLGFDCAVWAPKAVIKLLPSKAMSDISKHTESTTKNTNKQKNPIKTVFKRL